MTVELTLSSDSDPLEMSQSNFDEEKELLEVDSHYYLDVLFYNSWEDGYYYIEGSLQRC